MKTPAILLSIPWFQDTTLKAEYVIGMFVEIDGVLAVLSSTVVMMTL